MIIDNTDNLLFDVENDEDNNFIIITVSDAIGPVELGTFRIAKTRSEAFLDALKVISREIHGVYEINEKATTKFEEKTSGTLEFRDA